MYVVDLERTPSEILPVLVTKAPGVDMKLEGEKERRLRIDTEGLAIDVNDGGAKSMRLSCSSWDEFFLLCVAQRSQILSELQYWVISPKPSHMQWSGGLVV